MLLVFKAIKLLVFRAIKLFVFKAIDVLIDIVNLLIVLILN
jgi:hypothetical protein